MLFINQMFVFQWGQAIGGAEQSQIHCNLFEQLSGKVKCKQENEEDEREGVKVGKRKGFVCQEIIRLAL